MSQSVASASPALKLLKGYLAQGKKLDNSATSLADLLDGLSIKDDESCETVSALALAEKYDNDLLGVSEEDAAL
ncbi:hypothetical protein EV182_008880, partial [Spiromyces aspiralis]